MTTPSILRFEIRQVDAYEDEESCWCWNESIRLSDFTVVSTTNIPRKFVRSFINSAFISYQTASLSTMTATCSKSLTAKQNNHFSLH